MAKNLLKYILILMAIVVVATIIIIIYSFVIKSKDITSTQDKIKQEIAYLDEKLISVANSLNNLNTEYLLTTNEIKANVPNGSSESNSGTGKESQEESGSTENGSGQNNSGEATSQNETMQQTTITAINPKSILTRNRDDIDWKYINTALEEINNSWSIIAIDLKSIDVSSDDLVSFSNNMDIALKYTTANDKTNSLISVANLYSTIPNYESSYSRDSQNTEIKYVKSDIVSSYALLNTDRWSEILAFLNDADSRMSKLISMSSNSPNVQKIYVELKEYIKSVNDMDLDLCYMKYYYLMKDLENFSQ